MPIDPNISRYRDLLSQLPTGDWYGSDGIVVPVRSSPYELRYTTNKPNNQWGVFVNTIFQGVAKSDANGNLVVTVNLPLGECTVQIVDSIDKETTTSLLTTRIYATWFAAYAETLEQLDDYIDTIRLDSCLATCLAQDLSAVWGNRLGQGNPSYDSSTYRLVLEELLQAQRLFGAKLHGLEVGVGAFTQVPPLDWFRLFTGKRWVLGWSFVENRNFGQWEFQQTPSSDISGVSVTKFGPFAAPGGASYQWNVGTKVLTYTDPLLGPKTVTIDPARSGRYVVPGEELPAVIVSLPGPFNIVLGLNDTLEFDLDSKGIIQITLPPGVQNNAAIAASINAALNADLRYGVAYNTAASVFGGSVRFRLISVLTGDSASLRIYPSNGVSTVFGLTSTDLPKAISGFTDTLLDLNVVTESLPLVNVIAPVVIAKSPLPTGWIALGGSASLSHQNPRLSAVVDTNLLLTSLGSDVTLSKQVVAEASQYKGFSFTLSCWLSTQSVGVTLYLGASFDGGATWIESTAIPVTQTDDPFVLPTNYQWDFIYDPDATDLWVRLRLSSGGPAFSLNVADVQLEQKFVTAAYTASNTIPRYRHRSFFGHLLWGWSPVRLSAFEQESIGYAPFSNPKGQIDKLSAAHTQIDRFDVTEYDLITDEPLNLKGVINEADWSFATLTNLELVAMNPTRFSYVRSITSAPVLTEQLTFPNAPPYNAVLPLKGDQDQLASILFEGEVPLPQDQWSYVDAQTINVVNASFDPNAVYTLRYNPLLQAESDVIDLGPSWSDYVWYSDYHLYQRFSAENAELDQDIVLFVDFGSYTATLDRPANIDVNTASITRTDGTSEVELPSDSWSWLSPLVISFDGRAIVKGAIYRLKYREVGQKHEPVISTTFEVRSGPNPAAVLLASYKQIGRNTPIKTHNLNRYHQLRLTLRGLSDIRDLRLSSMCFKGLNAFGVNGTIPGLR
jgi:hypothetical protein